MNINQLNNNNNDIQRLNKDLEEAIDILLPYFRITDLEQRSFRKPTITILGNISSVRACYDMKKAEFAFREEDKYNPDSIGEEVSHYIHAEINPFYKNKPKSYGKLFYQTTNLIELVGRYGALIYCQQKGFPVEPVNWNKLIESSEGLFIGMTHYQGYTRAEKIFNEHGSRLLANISRMNIGEAQQQLPRIAPINLYEKMLLPIFTGLKNQINSWQ